MASNHRLAISTISLGWHATHTLDAKLHAASTHGYAGLELVYSDLATDALARNLSVVDDAYRVRDLCRQLNLGICSLSPFENFEGSQKVSLAERLGKAHLWVRLARILDSPIVQIPANDDLSSLAASADECIDELRMLADIGATPSSTGEEGTIIWAYEPMAWSARDDTWQKALHTIRRVARPNFKMCLDTYHILGKVWADCTRVNGRVPGGEKALKASLHDMTRMIYPQEVGFVQLSDAERMSPPLEMETTRAAGKHYSHWWCTWGRIFPYEEEFGAYLPMREICEAFLEGLGWRGWVSMEIFHRSMKEEEHGPEEWARRGVESWRRVDENLQIRSKM